mmetsp:Transcript_21797/g.39171  ORF Transcript_21797/g.39171 Transcript_21797/m.39171 type:complete len:216 (-) Transcript_21797:336-983(-)
MGTSVGLGGAGPVGPSRPGWHRLGPQHKAKLRCAWRPAAWPPGAELVAPWAPAFPHPGSSPRARRSTRSLDEGLTGECATCHGAAAPLCTRLQFAGSPVPLLGAHQGRHPHPTTGLQDSWRALSSSAVPHRVGTAETAQKVWGPLGLASPVTCRRGPEQCAQCEPRSQSVGASSASEEHCHALSRPPSEVSSTGPLCTSFPQSREHYCNPMPEPG